MTTLTNIRYPLALDEGGATVSIKDARHGGLFHCLGCAQDMSAKQGRLRAWHYAHKPPQARACDLDRVLHRTACELILSGFRNAVAQSGEYMLGRPCAHCGAPLMVNVAQAESILKGEESAVAGTRSDLVITHADREQLVIEVVHTHDLDESAATRYSQSGIPVLKIRPVWLPQGDGPATVASEPGLDGLTLDAGALAYDALNVGPCLCVRCKMREREEAAAKRQCQEREREEAAAKRQCQEREREEAKRQRSEQGRHQEEAKRLVSLTKLKTLPKLQPITQVGLDHNLSHATRTANLRSDTKHRINSQAYQLASVGFLQSPTRPTLFTYKANGLCIFADLDSTSVLKAWERSAPALYSFRGPGCRECVLQEVQRQLSKPKPRWDVHLPEVGDRAGSLAGGIRPLIAGPCGSGA